MNKYSMCRTRVVDRIFLLLLACFLLTVLVLQYFSHSKVSPPARIYIYIYMGIYLYILLYILSSVLIPSMIVVKSACKIFLNVLFKIF